MRRLNYRHDNITFDRLKSQVVLPKFQRSLVWTKDNKERFIDTILKGDPFGVLLLYRDDVNQNFTIIDGLQRYTTLLDFSRRPYDYVNFNIEKNEYISKVIDHITQEYPDSGREHILNQIKNEFKNVLSVYLESNNMERTYVSKRLYDFIIKTYGSLSPMSKSFILDSFTNFWIAQMDYINIEKLEIPIILYTGDFNNLPDIFERLNTGGTKLSKYEVYSSSWSNIMLKLIHNRNNRSVLNHVEKKYENLMEDTGIEITNFEEGDIKSTGRITLYEYVYGLGKEIIKESRVLTGNRPLSYSRDDSIGFSTLASFYNLHLKDLDKLVNYINGDTSALDFENITSIIIKNFQEVSEILSPYINNNTKYIEAQVISIVHTWFKLNFDLKNNKFIRKVRDVKLESDFKKYMPLRMLHDILTNHWSGSGDNKLYEIITADIENNRYMRPIGIDNWKSVLNNWIEEQNSKTTATVPMEVRMFLSFITNKDPSFRYVRNIIIPKNIVDNVNLGHLGNVFLAPIQTKFERNKLPLNDNKIEMQYCIPDEIFESPRSRYNSAEYFKIVNNRSDVLINRFIRKYYK